MARQNPWAAALFVGMVSLGCTDPGARAPAEAQAFLRDAAGGGAAEIELGRLAAERAASPDVKAFGKRMVEDHGRANQEIARLAAKKQTALPDAVDPQHEAMRERLATLSGPDFDEAYITEMVRDHVADVEAFERGLRLPDPEVAAFAAATLPTLQQHLNEARRVQVEVSRMQGSTAGDAPRLVVR